MCQISIIIPAYNASRYLREAIESVREQAPEIKKEFIVIDDGSQDSTIEVAESLKDVLLIRQQHQGAAAARNQGIRKASGAFLLLLDADDRLRSGALRCMYETLKEDSRLQAVFAKSIEFASEELTQEQLEGISVRTSAYTGSLTGNALLRREVFDRIGGFDESLKSAETVEWMMRLRSSGLPCASLDIIAQERRIHLSNTGRLRKQEEMRNYALLLKKRLMERKMQTGKKEE